MGTVQGTFQRQCEGALPVKGKLSHRKNTVAPAEALRAASDAPSRVTEAKTCPVCFEAFGDQLPQILTSCAHSFCSRCITNTLQARPPAFEGTCPLCRANVKLADLTFADGKTK